MFSHLRIRHVAVSTLVNNKKPIPQHNGLDVVHARQLIGYYVWGEKYVVTEDQTEGVSSVN